MTAVLDPLVGVWVRRQTWRDVLYAVLALPIGVFSLGSVAVLLGVGGALVILLVGIVIIAGTLILAAWAGRFDARLANRLVGAGVTPVPSPPAGASFVRGVMGAYASGDAWRALVWFVLRLPLGVVAVVCLVLPWFLGLGLLIAPFGGVLFDAAWWVRALALVGGASALLLFPHVMRGVGVMHGALARLLLGRSASAVVAEAEARTATAEARTDVARELHDSVGHSLTASVLQASAARRMLATDPEYADRALAAIEQQGRAALEDLDRVLALMRDDGAAARDVVGLEGVEALVESATHAGQPVDLSRGGDLNGVPRVVSAVAYRVVQEGLTNAMRHAAGARTGVCVCAHDARVTVRVENAAGQGPADARTAGGTGITGLRERVTAVGGTLTAGPRDGGGFRLDAEIPYGGRDA